MDKSTNTLTLWGSSGSPITEVQQHSTITDDVGIDGKFRPCTHIRRSFNQTGDLHQPYLFRRKGDPFHYKETGALRRVVLNENTQMNGYISSQSAIPLGIDWDGLTSEAVLAMLPSLSGDSSILTFIRELRDFRSFGNKVWQTYDSIVYDRWKGFASKFGEAVWASLGSEPYDTKYRKATNAVLAWKLAWRPFIGDVERFIRGLIKFRDATIQFKRRQHWRQQRYWGRNIPVTIAGSWAGTLVGTASPECGYKITRYFGEQDGKIARFTTVMRYRYTLPPDVLSLSNFIGAVLDQLGVNANPAIIWDNIPFSFVVDWFYNVGGLLSSLRVDNLRAVTIITDLSSSVKVKKEYSSDIELDLLTDPGDYNPGSVKEARLNGVLTYYERRNMDSSISLYDRPDGLSGNQAAVLSSLVYNQMSPNLSAKLSLYNRKRSLSDRR